MKNTGAASRKVIFVNSHPIQYFAPLYKYLNERGMPTECWYCSDENLRGHYDQQFGTTVAWDTPLLEGYRSRFFRNCSWKPSLYNGFFGLFNPGMIPALFRERKAIIVVHGWAYLTHLLVMVFARVLGHTVCLRGENPLNQELSKPKGTILAKQLLFRGLLFPFVQYFLFIGEQNRAFYQYYGVKPERLVFSPYAVDNARFRHNAGRYSPMRDALRKELKIPQASKVFLFSAKLIAKKRPMDLMRAFQALAEPDKFLLLVGDGEMRGELEQFASATDMKDFRITGFVNQSEIGKYYSIADVFVLCSGVGETWGLSVNEAMNFDLPVVVSDISGCSTDLVRSGVNGFIYPSGDINLLSESIAAAVAMGPVRHAQLEEFSFEGIHRGLQVLIDK